MFSRMERPQTKRSPPCTYSCCMNSQEVEGTGRGTPQRRIFGQRPLTRIFQELDFLALSIEGVLGDCISSLGPDGHYPEFKHVPVSVSGGGTPKSTKSLSFLSIFRCGRVRLLADIVAKCSACVGQRFIAISILLGTRGSCCR